MKFYHLNSKVVKKKFFRVYSISIYKKKTKHSLLLPPINRICEFVSVRFVRQT